MSLHFDVRIRQIVPDDRVSVVEDYQSSTRSIAKLDSVDAMVIGMKSFVGTVGLVFQVVTSA